MFVSLLISQVESLVLPRAYDEASRLWMYVFECPCGFVLLGTLHFVGFGMLSGCLAKLIV